eukprot:12202160-Ditylum_brightwellii.AAC.1
MQKAKMHFHEDLDSDSSFSPSTRSSVLPLTVTTTLRKRNLANSYDNLLSSFPVRKEESRELHQHIWKDQSFKDVCVVCSTLYTQKRKAGDDIDH